MTAKRVSLIVAAVAALCVGQNVAQAGDGWCGWGYGSCSWYTREYVPYYAMHPPVYYSYPVPRAYGWSPFAYPPGVMTPEILGEMAGPKEIINPHMPKAPEEIKPTSAKGKTAQVSYSDPIPQVVINPYVEPKLAAE
jgi:hypothetical protein